MAAALKSGSFWPWVAGIGALILGAVKAKFLFAGACRRNLKRIAALKTPRFWQFFRPVFFAFLAVMILAGAALSRLALESYPAMLAIGFLDGSIGAALLASSAVFWKERAFAAGVRGAGQ
jgi:predicted lysophospholipase L1 biosynthesis ABC-type transport system permease subunit